MTSRYLKIIYIYYNIFKQKKDEPKFDNYICAKLPDLLLLFGKHFGASGHEHEPDTPERGAQLQEASFAMWHSSPTPQISVCKI